MNMKIEKTWYASSIFEELGKSEELINMAGQWNARIQVDITKPYTYSKGPVETKTVEEKSTMLIEP